MGDQFEEDVSTGHTKLGLARFFSPTNLDRYRMLASRPISSGKRREIIMALAGEMKALKAELRIQRPG